MIYLEIGSRAYPLRFTARSLLRARERGGRKGGPLLGEGLEDTALMLYAALSDAVPHLTLRQAQSILHSFADSREKMDALLDSLARAYDESGFPGDGVTSEGFDKLLNAAANAGMENTYRLYDLTYAEIVRELNAYLARERLRRGLSCAAMTDEAMQHLITSMIRRDDDAHH